MRWEKPEEKGLRVSNKKQRSSLLSSLEVFKTCFNFLSGLLSRRGGEINVSLKAKGLKGTFKVKDQSLNSPNASPSTGHLACLASFSSPCSV